MMDRRQLLDRAARNGDERVLLAHILDKCEQSRKRNIPSATDFLSPAEQRSAQDLLHAAAIHDGCAFCGGFERAERRMLLFLPDWQDYLMSEDGPAAAVRAAYYEKDVLTHRDFLGSLMAQGVTREKLGDILVSEGSCDLIVSRDIAPYLLQNVTSAGRVKLSVSEIELSDLSVPELKVKEIRDTVSTLRLDAVGSGFSMSRSKAQELISSGRVQLNYRETLKSDAPVAQGDVISARGLGKFEVAEVGGLSKKGRTALLLRRYL